MPQTTRTIAANDSAAASAAELVVAAVVAPETVIALKAGLAAHSTTQGRSVYTVLPLSITRHDAHGQLCAGLVGHSFWNWLYIELLWVSPALQRQGLGSALLLAAEQEARHRQCRGIYLWTQSFQAPGFYEKHGYTIFTRFPDCPVGSERIGLMKDFSATM